MRKTNKHTPGHWARRAGVGKLSFHVILWMESRTRAPLTPHVPPWSLSLSVPLAAEVQWRRNDDYRPNLDRLVLILAAPAREVTGNGKIREETSRKESGSRQHRRTLALCRLSLQPEWSTCSAEWSPRAVYVLGVGDPGTRHRSRWTDLEWMKSVYTPLSINQGDGRCRKERGGCRKPQTWKNRPQWAPGHLLGC